MAQRTTPELPCADASMLVLLKASDEFAAIHGRLVGDEILDSWQEDGLHFFVFSLSAPEGAEQGNGIEEGPLAVFAMHPASSSPVSAVVVSPRPGGAEAEIRDLRSPGTFSVAPVDPNPVARRSDSRPDQILPPAHP
ncbi:MAG TPA: hypothetical protein VGR16_08235 [Thermomicrobiales bacterium]|nr:hypothetical protein [Thermomicrobiales bacterium]